MWTSMGKGLVIANTCLSAFCVGIAALIFVLPIDPKEISSREEELRVLRTRGEEIEKKIESLSSLSAAARTNERNQTKTNRETVEDYSKRLQQLSQQIRSIRERADAIQTDLQTNLIKKQQKVRGDVEGLAGEFAAAKQKNEETRGIRDDLTNRLHQAENQQAVLESRSSGLQRRIAEFQGSGG